MKAVVLLGPPGAGKGTVAEVLSENGYRHVSTGDLLRAQIKEQTPLGLEAKALMEQGMFVPDDVVVGMIHDLISSLEGSAMFLFDGFPRTLVQAEKLEELIESENGTLENVVLLQCPDEVIVNRLSGRRSCPECGAVYHMLYNAPKNGEVCDNDGAALVQRADDNEATIMNRLSVYAEQTAPLIDFYAEKGLVRAVNANQSIADVRADVMEQLA
ncbi:MAG: adenylate kinase [Pontiellaceae bacterium]|nr:adenylate kinase [Pontiellaceae bacterium]